MKKLWFVESGPDTRHPINVSVHTKYSEALYQYNKVTDKAKRMHSLSYSGKLCEGVNPQTLKQVFA